MTKSSETDNRQHNHRGEDYDTDGSYASPPCMMHEFESPGTEKMEQNELIALLNQLLEGERAGARGVSHMLKDPGEVSDASALRDVANDEARFCVMLTGHIFRLGGAASAKTGTFYDKLVGLDTTAARIDLLDRGQGWVVRKLRETLPSIDDEDLHRDLTEMLEVHEVNIARCADLM